MSCSAETKHPIFHFCGALHSFNFTGFYIPNSEPNTSNKCNISYSASRSELQFQVHSNRIDAAGFFSFGNETSCFFFGGTGLFWTFGVQVITRCSIILGCSFHSSSGAFIGITFNVSLHVQCFFKWKIVFCMTPTGGVISLHHAGNLQPLELLIIYIRTLDFSLFGT